MKIAIICTLYPPYVLGGAEISTSLLVEGLKKEGHNVVVVTTGKVNQKEYIGGITVYRLKNKNIYWRYPQREKNIFRKAVWHFIDIFNLGYYYKLRALLKKISPDIVHTGNLCGFSTIVWKVAQNLNLPIVHTLRDYYLLCPQQTMLSGSNSCEKQCIVCRNYSLIKKRMSQNVDAVVGISSFILDYHLEYGYFTNSKFRRCIPNSVNVPLDVNVSFRKNNSVGYIGRLSPEKGIEFMIEAFLKSNSRDTKLIIAGSGNKDYEEKLKRNYSKDNIVFCGTVKTNDFLKYVDLLIVPSLWNEPFGRVVIEAYAARVPVLISGNGGLRELAVDGLSKQFSTNDIDSLVTLLELHFCGKLVFNDAHFDNILSFYSEDKVVGNYIKLYSELLNLR